MDRYSAVVESLRGFLLIAGRAGWQICTRWQDQVGRCVSELLEPRGPMAGIPFDRCPERHPRRAMETPKASPFALVYSRSPGTGDGDREGDLLGGGVREGAGERPPVEKTFRRERYRTPGLRRRTCGVTDPVACVSAFTRWFWIMVYKLRGIYPDAEAWVDWTHDMKEWEKSRPRDPVTKRLRGDYDE